MQCTQPSLSKGTAKHVSEASILSSLPSNLDKAEIELREMKNESSLKWINDLRHRIPLCRIQNSHAHLETIISLVEAFYQLRLC